MLSFFYFYFSWIIVVIKRLFGYLYIWQKKEYRLDKLMDYINTPESKGFLWDRFTKIYFYLLCAILALSISKVLGLVEYLNLSLAIWILLIICNIIFWLDSIISILKFVKGRLIKPKFSSKMLVILGFSLVCVSFLTYFINTLTIDQAIITQLIILFALPAIVIICTIFIGPIDLYKKRKIVLKAKVKRTNLKDLKVIAISGSYGKSTTKDILFELLQNKYKVVKSIKNHNTDLSLARQLLALSDDNEIFIAEIGAYKKGDGDGKCVFLKPTTSIITGLNNQHLILFGSESNIIEAESESLAFLPPNSKAYINMDSVMSSKIQLPKEIDIVTYGLESKNMAQAVNIKTKDLDTHFTYVYNKNTTKLKTNLLSNGNVENLAGAITVALDFGIKMDDIAKTILDLDSTPGTLEVMVKPWGHLINDSYNANINGVLNAIGLLKNLPGKKILVLDDILELGEQSESTHQILGTTISQLNFDLIILMGRNYANIITDTLIENQYKGKYIVYDLNPAESEKAYQDLTIDKTTALLEGYRSRVFLTK
jgi:UDP-N-acetylmuramoyl-tripeptide--D-alanyl-D-alanine ligase